jgi:membrane-associated protein
MTEVISLVTTYGGWILFASAFLSCLLVPIPTSLMMLTAGAFVASGDLEFWQTYGAALFGAILGDQVGFNIGRLGGSKIIARMSAKPARQKIAERATKMIDKHGGVGVFFSTWLFAPLGPWVNFIAGSTRLNWLRFTVWDTLGETIWVSVYVGVGYIFAANLSDATDIAGNVLGILAAVALAVAMLVWIRKSIRAKKRDQSLPLSDAETKII